jgi:hypothetical protein
MKFFYSAVRLRLGYVHIALSRSKRPWLIALLASTLVHWGLLLALSANQTQGAPGALSSQIFSNVRLARPSPVKHSVEPAAKVSSASATGNSDETDEAAPLPEATDVEATGPEGESPFGAHYFSSDDLTVKPVFLRDEGAPAPTFIPDVMPLPVLAHLYINEQGGVDQVVLGESFLSDTAKQFILSSFNTSQFSPGMLGSLAVKSILTIEVKLDPTLPTR